jgi:hypothetical protein
LSSASKKKRRRRRPRSATPAQQPEAVSSATPDEKAEPKAPTAARSRRAAAADERPPAPWGSFPLVEIIVLIGIVMLVIGLIVGTDEARGQTLLFTGLALASLAGLELSIREHFAGFRSHTALLASAVTVVVMLGTYYLAELDATPALIIGAVAGVVAAVGLVRVFRAQSGGRSVKLR